MQLDAKLRDELYPKSGNRDIVGFGINGYPMYFDRVGLPFPSLRFKANSPDVLQLREKEKGDWRKLSLEDKKALYRASFRMTLSEVSAPSGEWKLVLGCTFFMLSWCAILYWGLKYFRKLAVSAVVRAKLFMCLSKKEDRVRIRYSL